MSNDNEYMRRYMYDRYHQRRAEYIRQLGGKCTQCGSIENLEIDHVDPKTKKFSLSKIWNCKKEKVDNELAKCQLLCESCHQRKTLLESGKQDARKVHGIRSAYNRGCRCKLCKKVHSDYMRKWRKNNNVKRIS